MLEELLRWKDLQRLRIVSSWPQLKFMQDNYDFPRGFLLGANTRAWRKSEIEGWLANRPVEPSSQTIKRLEKAKRARREIAEAMP
jgi:predicted DNA-binding transcriptional regulator AlpA